ncbi:hypothetical protein HDU93_007606 [Gonapodya sp. JEL0774]|nr:hypothetical protein HDU93_007606 [Gonapodya sp. JEL0774]
MSGSVVGGSRESTMASMVGVGVMGIAGDGGGGPMNPTFGNEWGTVMRAVAGAEHLASLVLYLAASYWALASAVVVLVSLVLGRLSLALPLLPGLYPSPIPPTTPSFAAPSPEPSTDSKSITIDPTSITTSSLSEFESPPSSPSLSASTLSVLSADGPDVFNCKSQSSTTAISSLQVPFTPVRHDGEECIDLHRDAGSTSTLSPVDVVPHTPSSLPSERSSGTLPSQLDAQTSSTSSPYALTIAHSRSYLELEAPCDTTLEAIPTSEQHTVEVSAPANWRGHVVEQVPVVEISVILARSTTQNQSKVGEPALDSLPPLPTPPRSPPPHRSIDSATEQPQTGQVQAPPSPASTTCRVACASDSSSEAAINRRRNNPTRSRSQKSTRDPKLFAHTTPRLPRTPVTLASLDAILDSSLPPLFRRARRVSYNSQCRVRVFTPRKWESKEIVVNSAIAAKKDGFWWWGGRKEKERKGKCKGKDLPAVTQRDAVELDVEALLGGWWGVVNGQHGIGEMEVLASAPIGKPEAAHSAMDRTSASLQTAPRSSLSGEHLKPEQETAYWRSLAWDLSVMAVGVVVAGGL